MTEERPTPPTGSDLEVGDAGPEVVVEDLSREDFVKYAGASGDFHPVHYDVPYARDAGNPDAFAQGMLTAGFGASLVADWFGLANVNRYSVRFQARVFPGETVTVTGEVSAVEETDRGVSVEADIVAKTDADEVVLSGQASALLPHTE
jgi:acyl dehydratase